MNASTRALHGLCPMLRIEQVLVHYFIINYNFIMIVQTFITTRTVSLLPRGGRVGLLTEQRDEWEEGMPPESTNAFGSKTPVLNHLVKIWRATQRCAEGR
jgi:hypothetical protein